MSDALPALRRARGPGQARLAGRPLADGDEAWLDAHLVNAVTVAGAPWTVEGASDALAARLADRAVRLDQGPIGVLRARLGLREGPFEASDTAPLDTSLAFGATRASPGARLRSVGGSAVQRQEPPRRAPAAPAMSAAGPVLSIDVGGTDVKLAWIDGRSLRTALVRWASLGASPFRAGSTAAWAPAVAAAVRASGLPPAAQVAVALPELVVDGVLRGGVSGKCAAIPGGLQGAIADADAHLPGFATALAAALGVPHLPVRVVSDGQAAALCAAPGEIGLALGTSVGGGLRGEDRGLTRAMPYVSGAVVWPSRAGVHDRLGLRGTAQSGPCRKGLMAWGLPGDADAATIAGLVRHRGVRAVAADVADLVEELAFWTGARAVRLVGAVVAGEVGVEVAELAAGLLQDVGARIAVTRVEQAATAQAEALGRYIAGAATGSARIDASPEALG